MLPSRCTLGESFCQGTCHAIGRRDGSCEYGRVSYLLAVLIKCGRNLLLLICRVVNVLRKGWALLSSCFAPLNRLVGPIANAEARLMEGAMDGNVSVLAMLLLKILKPKYFKSFERWNKQLVSEKFYLFSLVHCIPKKSTFVVYFTSRHICAAIYWVCKYNLFMYVALITHQTAWPSVTTQSYLAGNFLDFQSKIILFSIDPFHISTSYWLILFLFMRCTFALLFVL